ncbi:hypothetical protein CW740_04360 [Kangiella profundi]|uniref:Uncharacterized protein n=1 Tax=Kangiella profundi TaxID=1561924 RepID=A0A2K9ADQ5_9GAMM|nr:hypothetical protein CW740_04360 [Kangiella profundi]
MRDRWFLNNHRKFKGNDVDQGYIVCFRVSLVQDMACTSHVLVLFFPHDQGHAVLARQFL